MRILLSARRFDQMAGGLERQAISLLNAFTKRGHECHLLTRDQRTATSFYPLDPAVQWHKLDVEEATQARLASRFDRLRRTRRLIKEIKPDVVLGFQFGPFYITRLASLGLWSYKTHYVAAERVSPFQFEFVNRGFKRHWVRQNFRLADKITVQCPSYVEAYPKFLQRKIQVIPNAVQLAAMTANPGKPTEEGLFELLCVGRLCDQKNQALLLDAFARLSPEFPDWRLTFVGDGPEDSVRKQQASELKIGHKVNFAGAQMDVSQFYAKAHVFAFPSKWEGFPNALAEALAHGLPSVGFAGCGGTRDLISQGQTGLLAEGNDRLEPFVEALRQVMSDAGTRRSMGQAAVEAMKAYEPAAILDQWERFFIDLKAQRRM